MNTQPSIVNQSAEKPDDFFKRAEKLLLRTALLILLIIELAKVLIPATAALTSYVYTTKTDATPAAQSPR